MQFTSQNWWCLWYKTWDHGNAETKNLITTWVLKYIANEYCISEVNVRLPYDVSTGERQLNSPRQLNSQSAVASTLYPMAAPYYLPVRTMLTRQVSETWDAVLAQRIPATGELCSVEGFLQSCVSHVEGWHPPWGGCIKTEGSSCNLVFCVLQLQTDRPVAGLQHILSTL